MFKQCSTNQFATFDESFSPNINRIKIPTVSKPFGKIFQNQLSKIQNVQYQELTKAKYGVSRIDFDLGNPLPARQKVEISIDFSAKETLTSSTSTYDFAFNVTSSNPEIASTLADNYFEMRVPLRVDIQLETSG